MLRKESMIVEKNVIACELHDYVEVACMYNYQLKLILKDGQVMEGKAVDIVQSDDHRELLIIDNGAQEQVDLMTLSKMQVLTPNANFKEVIF
ncbi:Rho-binding antiterminator [Nitrosomonas sp.]|uniref:Rho-binding antiterminator n=1 Tax=Nitrosomonas sp. TaxID=42353 RepID=UPI0025DAF967|nr:Rho-binding antiterminator [Nitrosomonas sp.]